VFLASSISGRIRPFFRFSAVCKFARKKVFHSWIETLQKNLEVDHIHGWPDHLALSLFKFDDHLRALLNLE